MSKLAEYKKMLAKFVSFKSISTDKQYRSEMDKTVNWLKELLVESGFGVEVWEGKSNPVVYGAYYSKAATETVMIYGHYDVQPADKNEGWETDPWKLAERGGRLFARGVVDNKGQILVHIFSVLELIKAGKLTKNVKFVIEGDEETGVGDLAELMDRQKQKLADVDVVIVSDGEVVAGKPVLETSLRGGFNAKIVYKTSKNTLHSGIYGGAVPNAALELAWLVAGIKDDKNRVKLPGFYDNVRQINDKQRENNRRLVSEAEVLEISKVKRLLLSGDEDFYSATGLLPTVEVSGFKAGYVGQGFANIVPPEAEVRLNFRLVADQDPAQVAVNFEAWVAAMRPDYVEYEVEVVGLHKPVRVEVGSQRAKEVVALLEKAFGDKVLYKPVGGAIPFVCDAQELLGVEVFLISMGNDDCNMHGANENFDLNLLKKDLRFSWLFFST